MTKIKVEISETTKRKTKELRTNLFILLVNQ